MNKDWVELMQAKRENSMYMTLVEEGQKQEQIVERIYERAKRTGEYSNNIGIEANNKPMQKFRQIGDLEYSASTEGKGASVAVCS